MVYSIHVTYILPPVRQQQQQQQQSNGGVTCCHNVQLSDPKRFGLRWSLASKGVAAVPVHNHRHTYVLGSCNLHSTPVLAVICCWPQQA